MIIVGEINSNHDWQADRIGKILDYNNLNN